MTGLDDPDLVLRFWKPYDCLTAFTDRDGRQTLADHIDVPNVYPAADSIETAKASCCSRATRRSAATSPMPRSVTLAPISCTWRGSRPTTRFIISPQASISRTAARVQPPRSSSLQNRRSRPDQYRSAFASRFLIPGFVSRSPKARIARYVE